MKSRARTSALVAAMLLASSCVSGRYERVNVNEPRADPVVEPLIDMSASLQDCLNSLGAPNFVWPSDDGTALAWAHTHERGWGVRATVPVDNASASATYNSAVAKAEAIVIFFDDDWTMLFLRRGKLADLMQAHPRRVQPVEPREKEATPSPELP